MTSLPTVSHTPIAFTVTFRSVIPRYIGVSIKDTRMTSVEWLHSLYIALPHTADRLHWVYWEKVHQDFVVGSVGFCEIARLYRSPVEKAALF